MDLKGLFDSIDRMDPSRFVSFLTADGTFKMGSFPAVQGRQAAADFVEGFWTTVETSSHSDIRSYESGPEDLFVAGTVTYGLKNGKEVSVPFLNHFWLDGEFIAKYVIYLDPTPVAAALATTA